MVRWLVLHVVAVVLDWLFPPRESSIGCLSNDQIDRLP